METEVKLEHDNDNDDDDVRDEPTDYDLTFIAEWSGAILQHIREK